MGRPARRPVETDGDLRLGGWVQGEGTPHLLLHGGPCLGAEYLDPLADELAGCGALASYQQRGMAPSRLEGPFTIADHCADACRVLDALGWDRAVLVGHSWGGHLALHVAAHAPDRVAAVLAVDPIGGVGDGGAQAFVSELLSRCPERVRARVRELDEREERGVLTDTEAEEALELLWPAYFPSWAAAPPMPPGRTSMNGYAETCASMVQELPRLEAALPGIAVPVRFVVGGASPIPVTASTDTAARVPGARVEVVPGAGHFPWVDQPGCVRAALQRLTG